MCTVKLNSSGSYVMFAQAFCFHLSYKIREQHPQTPPRHWQGPCLVAVTVSFPDEFVACFSSVFSCFNSSTENSSISLLTISLFVVRFSSILDTEADRVARTTINSQKAVCFILCPWSCPTFNQGKRTSPQDVLLPERSKLDWPVSECSFVDPVLRWNLA